MRIVFAIPGLFGDTAMLARRMTVLAAGFALALSIALLSPRAVPANDEPAPRKLALLVGVKKYKHNDLKDLDYPENDVEELADVLRQLNFSVTVLTTRAGRANQDLFPDAANIRRQLSAILRDASKSDLIVVALAGHGVQPLESSQSYFCPYDDNPRESEGRLARPETLLSIGEILGQLRDSGIGQKLLLVDACRNDPQVRGARRGLTQVETSSLPEQTGVLLSCRAGEFSFESNSYGTGHGAFFYEVIEGLKGNAKDSDGEISWESLRTYVRKHVPAKVREVFGKNGGEQNPNELGNLNGVPIVLARITSTSRTPPSSKEPELLVAPFDADKAQASREAWARYQQVDEQTTNSVGMKLTLIPPGEFQMGSSATDVNKALGFNSGLKRELYANEQPQHRVRITKPFYLGTYEVTKGEFSRFVDETDYKTEAEKDARGGFGYTGEPNAPLAQRPGFTWRDWGVNQNAASPVVNVTWSDAMQFCNWLSKKEGKTY